MLTNILQYLETTVTEVPDKVAFSTGADAPDASLTFSALHTHARAIGARLLAAGRRGEPVAVLMDKHPHAIATFFGIIYAGGRHISVQRGVEAARVQHAEEGGDGVGMLVHQHRHGLAVVTIPQKARAYGTGVGM